MLEKKRRKIGRGKRFPSFLIYLHTRAGSCKTVKLLLVGLLVVYHMPGVLFIVGLGNGLQQIQYTVPTEMVHGNKFLIAKAI